MDTKNETKMDLGAVSVKKVSKRLLFLKTVFHFSVLFHFMVVLCVGIHIYLGITEKQLEIVLIRTAKTYFPAFFTIWNVTFQTTFLCLALLHDILQWVDKHGTRIGKQVKYVRDIVFNGLVVPFTCFVSSMFWTVYAIDRELVFPRVYDEVLPWWLNHCVHTNIILVVAMETLLQTRRYPTDKKVETICYVFISVFYAVVYYSIYFFAHVWLYGVFGVMTWWQVCLYQLAIWASAYIFYNMIFVINRMIHGAESLEEVCASVEKIDEFPKVQDLKQFGNDREVGSELAKGDYAHTEIETKQSSDMKTGEVVENGRIEGEDKRKVNGHDQSGVEENGKDWKSIEVNGEEIDSNGLSKPFDKSWSTKYRTNRNLFENSSL